MTEKHSITFGDKNTWRDWHLYTMTQPVFALPKHRSKTVEIPGRSGELDLSDTVTGYPMFENRTGTFKFFLGDSFSRYMIVFDEIVDYLHGRRMDAVLSDEPGWIYTGRFTVDTRECSPKHGLIVVGYSVDPYKWAMEWTDEPWLWDPFSFVDGVIGNGTYTDPVSGRVYRGADVFSQIDIPVGDGIELAFPTKATGNAPVAVEFKNAGSTSLVFNIMQDGAFVTGMGISAGSTVGTTIQGLLLYRGSWLYGGRPAEVQVQIPPRTFTLTEDPDDITGEAGSNVTFHVAQVGGVDVTYQWQYMTANGSTWQNNQSFTGCKTHTMTVPVTTARNGYKFRCKVTSGDVTLTSNYATLTTGTPTFGIVCSPLNKTQYVGESAIFHVSAEGSSLTYRWQYLKPGGSWTNLPSSITGYNTDTLTVEATETRNGYQYRCAVTSSGTTLHSDAATLTVLHGTVAMRFRRGRI